MAERRILTPKDVLRECRTGGRAAQFCLQEGDVLGDLTVEAFYDSAPDGSRRFVFRCECGRTHVQRGSYVVHRLRNNANVACSECLRSLRALDYELGQEDRVAYYRQLWEETGSLYTPAFDRAYRDCTLADLERQIAPMRDLEEEGAKERLRRETVFWYQHDYKNQVDRSAMAARAREQRERDAAEGARKLTAAAQEQKRAELDFARAVQEEQRRRRMVDEKLSELAQKRERMKREPVRPRPARSGWLSTLVDELHLQDLKTVDGDLPIYLPKNAYEGEFPVLRGRLAAVIAAPEHAHQGVRPVMILVRNVVAATKGIHALTRSVVGVPEGGDVLVPFTRDLAAREGFLQKVASGANEGRFEVLGPEEMGDGSVMWRWKVTVTPLRPPTPEVAMAV